MFEVSWTLFIIASLLLIVTPGVSIGLVGHSVLAALGLGAILRTFEYFEPEDRHFLLRV